MSSDFNTVVSGSRVPITYGAIMINSDGIRTESTVNIYTSISNLSDAYVPKVDSHNDVDDYFIVMPGYMLRVYTDTNHQGNFYDINARTSANPLFKKSNTNTANSVSSVKLYHENVEITELIT